jgi:hypothetical protein
MACGASASARITQTALRIAAFRDPGAHGATAPNPPAAAGAPAHGAQAKAAGWPPPGV